MAFTLATNLLLYVIAVGAPGAVSGKIFGSGLGVGNTTAISKTISLPANSTCTSVDPLAPSPSCPILVGPVPANTSLCHQCPTSFEAVQSCPYSCQLLPLEAGVSSGPFCSMANVTGQILESGFGPARCQRCLPPCDKSTTSVTSTMTTALARSSAITASSTSSTANNTSSSFSIAGNASVSTSAASRDSTFTSKTDKLSTPTSTADKDSMLASTADKDPATSAADKDPMSTLTAGKDSTSASKADNDSTSTSTGDKHLTSTSTDKTTASTTPADGPPMSTSATDNGMSLTTTANKESPPTSKNGKDSTSTSSISMQTIESTSTSKPGTSITASPACTTRQAAWPFQGQPKAPQRGWGFWHGLGRRHEWYGAPGCEPGETSTWPKT